MKLVHAEHLLSKCHIAVERRNILVNAREQPLTDLRGHIVSADRRLKGALIPSRLRKEEKLLHLRIVERRNGVPEALIGSVVLLKHFLAELTVRRCLEQRKPAVRNLHFLVAVLYRRELHVRILQHREALIGGKCHDVCRREQLLLALIQRVRRKANRIVNRNLKCAKRRAALIVGVHLLLAECQHFRLNESCLLKDLYIRTLCFL